MKLINKSNRMKTIILPHQIYCAALGHCECIQLPGMKNKVAASLTIPVGMTSDALPDELLQMSQIKKGVKRGELEVVAAKVKKNKSKSSRNADGGSEEQTASSRIESPQAHHSNISKGERA